MLGLNQFSNYLDMKTAREVRSEQCYLKALKVKSTSLISYLQSLQFMCVAKETQD